MSRGKINKILFILPRFNDVNFCIKSMKSNSSFQQNNMLDHINVNDFLTTIINYAKSYNGKMKTKWEGQFFSKKIQEYSSR